MECKEFERLLWDGPGVLNASMDEHLKTCPKCRESYARYRQIFVLAEQSEVDRSEAFWQNFNSAVWEKIDKTAVKTAVSHMGLWQRPAMNFRRLSLSVGLAVVTVTILVVLVTDLTRKAPPPIPIATENYRTFDVTLQSAPQKSQEFAEEQITAGDNIHQETTLLKGESEKDQTAKSQSSDTKSIAKNESRIDSTTMLGSFDSTNQISLYRGGRAADFMAPSAPTETHPVSEMAARLKKTENSGNGLMAVPQITDDSNQVLTFQQFSILTEPKTEQKGDSGSVSIDAVFLTDDGLEDKQISVAQSVSADDVVMNRPSRISLSGLKTQQSSFARPQVVSFSKMPRPKHLSTPKYPSVAYSLGMEGEVWVKAFVNISGKVEQAEIYKGTDFDYGFEEEALKAAYKNEFEPLEIDGQKTPVWVIYKVKFIKAK